MSGRLRLQIPSTLKYKRYNKKFEHSSGLSEYRVCYLSKNFSYGLVAVESGFMPLKQIESLIGVINKTINIRAMRRKNRKRVLRATVYARAPRTRKSMGLRMGKGKGKVDVWGFFVKKNRLIFELSKHVNKKNAQNALRQAKFRMPFKTKIVQDVL